MKFYLTNTLDNIKQEYPELLQQKAVIEDSDGNLFIEIDNLEELLDLSKGYGDLIIDHTYAICLSDKSVLKIPKIEIYDDYME
jgi:hypothetical protein